jgi:hypothetical protein
MNDQDMKEIAEWMNTRGFDIDTSDCFYMEEMRYDEHKTRDIIELIYDYNKYMESKDVLICDSCQADMYPNHTYCWSCGEKYER